MMQMLQKVWNKWAFLGFVAVVYILAWVYNPLTVPKALETSSRIFVEVIPVFLLVMGMMFLANMFLDAKKITAYVGKGSGARGWIFAIAGGIISSGPIYMWYPLLSEIREKGMRNSLIAAFLYNRAVKIPLLPIMIYYFGWKFALILTVLMVIFSVINGMIVERITEVNNEDSNCFKGKE